MSGIERISLVMRVQSPIELFRGVAAGRLLGRAITYAIWKYAIDMAPTGPDELRPTSQ